MKKINEKLKLLYEMLGSQSKLAKIAGVAQPLVSQWIRGVVEIQDDQISDIAGFFEIEIGMLTNDSVELSVEIDVREKWIRTMKKPINVSESQIQEDGEVVDAFLRHIAKARKSKNIHARLIPVQGILGWLMDRADGYRLTQAHKQMLDEAESLTNATQNFVSETEKRIELLSHERDEWKARLSAIESSVKEGFAAIESRLAAIEKAKYRDMEETLDFADEAPLDPSVKSEETDTAKNARSRRKNNKAPKTK